jgi:hypothetical protein
MDFPARSTGRSRAFYLLWDFYENSGTAILLARWSTAFRLELAGNLNRQGVCRLDHDWRSVSSVIGDRTLIIDMTFVTGIDQEGRALIVRWNREGAQLIANSKASRALAESILGRPLPEAPAAEPTWLAMILLLLATIAFPVETNAATLKSDTVTAWDDYVQR